MTLVLAEDVVDEVYAVIEETFRDHHDLPGALGLLDAVFGSGELIQRREYLENVGKWERRLRDPTDAPLAGAAEVAGVDGLLSGDRDFLSLGHIGRIKLLRMREVLGLLGHRP